jgi:hypothetical protein
MMIWFNKAIDRLKSLGGLRDQRWRVANAELLRNKDPRSFSIPRLEQRRSCCAGDTVKVLLEPIHKDSSQPFSGERPWLTVTYVDEKSYKGVADSGLVLFPELEGKEIEFKPENIIALILPDTYALPFGKTCQVSRAVLAEDSWPTNLVRVAPENASDSGWRIFHAGGSLADLSESVDCGALIGRFQMLDSVMDEPGLKSWCWDSVENEYKLLTESTK